MDISHEGKSNLKNAQMALEKFYHLKSEEQKFQKALENSKKSKNFSELKNIDVSEVSIL